MLGPWSHHKPRRESAVWSRAAWTRAQSCCWTAGTSKSKVTRAATLWVPPSSATWRCVSPDVCFRTPTIPPWAPLHVNVCALAAWHEVLQWRDLRACAGGSGGRHPGWCHLYGQQEPLRQRHSHLHHQRRHGAQIHSRGGRGPGERCENSETFSKTVTRVKYTMIFLLKQSPVCHHLK